MWCKVRRWKKGRFAYWWNVLVKWAMIIKGYTESLDSAGAGCSNDGACDVNWRNRSWRCRALSSREPDGFWLVWVECEPVNTKRMVELNEIMRHCSMSCTVGVGAAGGMEMNNWVSSAYCWCEMPYELISWPTGEVYKENRSGPRTEPWGTPVFRGAKLDWDVPIATHWLRFERYYLIQLSAKPVTPKLFSSLLSRVLWSMVSNAALTR